MAAGLGRTMTGKPYSGRTRSLSMGSKAAPVLTAWPTSRSTSPSRLRWLRLARRHCLMPSLGSPEQTDHTMRREASIPYLLAGQFHKMAFDAWGDPEAPAVVCVHGLTRNGRDFDALARALSDRFHGHLPRPAWTRKLGQAARPDALPGAALRHRPRPPSRLDRQGGRLDRHIPRRHLRHGDRRDAGSADKPSGAERCRAVHPGRFVEAHPRLHGGVRRLADDGALPRSELGRAASASGPRAVRSAVR